MLWDVFISHASEDKDVARALAQRLQASGLRVWFDETQLRLGDSLLLKINEGLAQSRFGVVIVSPAFLEKEWPLRELAALSALFGPTSGGLLPVWHEVSSKDLERALPTLLDPVAVSTSAGIEAVAEKIVDVVAPYLRPGRTNRSREYLARIPLPYDLVGRALDSLVSLARPDVWPHFEITLPGYPQTGWLGSDSSTLIETVYDFAAPLYAGRALGYAARRNSALLDRRSKLHLTLLEAALDAFLDETDLASVDPIIPYSPRVPDWRTKRLLDPARYWWQGISPDRFDELRPLFLQPVSSGDGVVELTPAAEFHETYRALSREASPDPRQQQALGILANAFFGFRPRARPTFWRVLVCQAWIYHAILGNSQFDMESDTADESARIFQVRDPTPFPFAPPPIAAEDLFESFDVTLAAASQYLTAFVVPRLAIALRQPQPS